MEDNSNLYRKKSMDRVSSPEQLDGYIRVTSPSIWLILIAMIVLLSGALIWGFLGTVEVSDENGNEMEIHPIEFIIN